VPLFLWKYSSSNAVPVSGHFESFPAVSGFVWIVFELPDCSVISWRMLLNFGSACTFMLGVSRSSRRKTGKRLGKAIRKTNSWHMISFKIICYHLTIFLNMMLRVILEWCLCKSVSWRGPPRHGVDAAFGSHFVSVSIWSAIAMAGEKFRSRWPPDPRISEQTSTTLSNWFQLISTDFNWSQEMVKLTLSNCLTQRSITMLTRACMRRSLSTGPGPAWAE